MSREWKPGDAAVAEWMGREVRGFIDTDGRFYTTDQSVNGVSSSAFALSSLRPLAVVDTEDRREIQRLLIAFCRAANLTVGTISGTDAMQAALREYANPKPPRPAEPQGLGAVVEDEDGTLWFRMAYENQTWPGEVWQEQYGDADRWSKWDSVAAVRVLSPGVEVDQ